MQRDKYHTYFTVRSMLNAVERKTQYHQDKVDYYTKQVEKTVETIKERGIIVEEKGSSGQFGSTQYRVGSRIDPELSEELDYNQGRKIHHEGKVREYRRWQDLFLCMMQGDVVSVDVDDVQFFGLTEKDHDGKSRKETS